MANPTRPTSPHPGRSILGLSIISLLLCSTAIRAVWGASPSTFSTLSTPSIPSTSSTIPSMHRTGCFLHGTRPLPSPQLTQRTQRTQWPQLLPQRTQRSKPVASASIRQSIPSLGYNSYNSCYGRIRNGHSATVSTKPTRSIGSTALSLAENSSQLENPNPKSPKKNPLEILKRTFVSIYQLLLKLPKAIVAAAVSAPKKLAQLPSYFSKLSKVGKLILSLQILSLGLLLGVGLKSTSDLRERVFHGSSRSTRPVEVGYSTFLDLVDVSGKGHQPGVNPALKLENVIISKDRIGFRVITDTPKHELALKDKKLVQSNDVSITELPVTKRTVYAMKPPANQDLMDKLRDNGIPFRAASVKGANAAGNLARFSLIAVYLLFLRKMYQSIGGGGGSGGGLSGAPGKLATFSNDEPLVKFEDIEGIDSAKFEVMELVDTLRNPKKYEILGARAPTGLLLEGPPGTGKTMLARATAATAGVPLLYCSGSDFVEMFVGRGAARVRNTFARAAKLAPCIIFIDELDALGKSRDMGLGGLGGSGANFRSNDEAEQTLNQLLACMDGLDSSRRVCVLAATNRREVLDPALIRPGRFDRIIKVTLPDVKGRERILRVHAKKLPGFTECEGVDEKRPGSLGKGSSVDLSAVATVTKGLCGADLEFIVNEAAIRAVRRVSSQLRSGDDPKSITPTVSAEDFETSVVDFYETRRPKGMSGGMGDLLNNVLRT